MDRLLERARGLYKDRQRIALSAFIVVFAFTFYMFYSPGIIGLGAEPPQWFPPGWSQGLEVVVSFNTLGFFLAFALMVFAYSFWQWAFLPTPAVNYTLGVLRGILGPKVQIKHRIGKRFRVFLEDGKFVDILCRIREHESGEWFVYRLTSSPLFSTKLSSLALRHGMSVSKDRLTTCISNDELHSRIVLMLRAISLVS